MTTRTIVGTVVDSTGKSVQTVPFTLTVNPAPSGTLWGTSIRNDAGAAAIPGTVSDTHPDVMRFYNSGALSGWSASSATKCPAGIVPFDSAKWDIASMKANNATTMAQITDWLTKSPKKYGAIQHEADNPSKGIAPADYVAALTNVMKLPQGQTTFAPTVMAWTLVPASGRNMDDWYVPTAPVLGFDCYGSHTGGLQDTVQIPLSAQYAAKKNKPWVIPELGYQAISSSQPAPSDSVLLEWMKRVVAQIKALPNPPLAVSWMNHGVNTLGQGSNPLSTAYWASL